MFLLGGLCPWGQRPLRDGDPLDRQPLDRDPHWQRPPRKRPSLRPPYTDPFGQRPPWTETPRRETPPGQRTFRMVKIGRYASFWNAFLFQNCLFFNLQTSLFLCVIKFRITGKRENSLTPLYTMPTMPLHTVRLGSFGPPHCLSSGSTILYLQFAHCIIRDLVAFGLLRNGGDSIMPDFIPLSIVGVWAPSNLTHTKE